MNARYLSMLSLDELIPYVREELKSEGLWDDAFDKEKRTWFENTINLIRTRLYTIRDFSSRGRPYFSDEFPYDEAAVKKNLKKDKNIKSYFPKLADTLEGVEIFDIENTEKAIRDLSEDLNVKPGILINAVRTAVTGQAAGPGLFEILASVGKDRTVKRIRKAVELI